MIGANGKVITCIECGAPVESFTTADLMPMCDACDKAAIKNAGHWAGTVKEQTVRTPISLQVSPKPASR